MQLRTLSVFGLSLILLTAPSLYGQSPDDSRTLELVDQLKEVIQRGERSRADNATLNQLRDLVRRYDWPWRVKLLFDDFSDGDFTHNPAWTVGRGDFRVVRGSGLRSYVGADTVTRPAPTERGGSTGGSTLEGIIGGILRGVLEPPTPGNQLRGVLPVAEISTPVAIGNAFAVRLRMVARERAPEGARVEFGVYRGNERDWGYRLAYVPGPRPSLELVRVSPGRSAVVERFDGATGLEDGRAHQLELRRERDGNMQVWVDNRELIRTVDRGVSDVFDGFMILNGGGEYNFERIELFGTER